MSCYELWHFLRVLTLRFKLREPGDNFNGHVERSLRTHPPASHRSLVPSPRLLLFAFRRGHRIQIVAAMVASPDVATVTHIPSPAEFVNIVTPPPRIPSLPAAAVLFSPLSTSPNHASFQICCSTYRSSACCFLSPCLLYYICCTYTYLVGLLEPV